MLITIRIIVIGKVQGVFYRETTKEKALQIGVTGEVENLTNGSVKIIATGTSEQLDALKIWCRIGPAKASVNDLSIEELPLQNFDTFKVNRN